MLSKLFAGCCIEPIVGEVKVEALPQFPPPPDYTVPGRECKMETQLVLRRKAGREEGQGEGGRP